MQTVEKGLSGDGGMAYPGGMARRSGPLRAQCLRDEEAGRITRKTEATAERNIVYEYEYDDDGRLFRVFRDGLMTEQYMYTGPASGR